MIGWRCSVAYSTTSFSEGININSITFLDNGIYAVFPELFDATRVISKDPTLFYNQIKEQTPAIDYLCTLLDFSPAISSSDLEKLRIAVPSIRTGFPNTYKYFYENNITTGYILQYIPSLKKAFSYRVKSGYPDVTLYNVSENILIKQGQYLSVNVGYLNRVSGFTSEQANAWVFCYNGDFSPKSLSDNNNTHFIHISWANDEYSFRQENINKNYLFILNLFKDYVQPDVSTPVNPYEPGGDSEEGGGNGSFDDESDIITIPSLPTISSADTGFTRIYNPTLAQVQELAHYLWTGESVIETIWNHIKQYFENPMEAIIGFNLVPVPVPNGGTTTFKLMYIDTGVSMTAAANQFVDVDCGTLELKEYYGSALDYSPFTKISCFLPYIGNVSLNVDEVMGRTLGVKYRVDICSGACVAYITVDGNAIYQYSGHCSIPIPISAADFSSYVTSVIATAKLATAGITAGMGVAAGMMATDPEPQTNKIVKITKQVSTARNPATGRQITTGTTTTTVEKPTSTDQDNTAASFSGLAPQNIANTVGTIMGSKPHIEHSGSFSGNSGYLGVRRPFLIIQRPNMCMPSNYQQLNGFPAMITMKLSECEGFTRVQQVQLTELPATNPEQAEILQLLKTGVIL